jgi:hypothetical protein
VSRLLKFLDAHISFKALLWLIPFVLTAHNFEEALTMPVWVPKNIFSIREMMPFHLTVGFSSAQLLTSLLFATIVPFLVTILCINGEKGSIRLNLLFILQSVVLLNVFIPHIVVSVLLLRYNPGVITAVAVNFPFSLYFFRRVLKEDYLNWKKMRVLFIVSLFLYAAVAALLHYLGQFIAAIFFT